MSMDKLKRNIEQEQIDNKNVTYWRNAMIELLKAAAKDDVFLAISPEHNGQPGTSPFADGDMPRVDINPEAGGRYDYGTMTYLEPDPVKIDDRAVISRVFVSATVAKKTYVEKTGDKQFIRERMALDKIGLPKPKHDFTYIHGFQVDPNAALSPQLDKPDTNEDGSSKVPSALNFGNMDYKPELKMNAPVNKDGTPWEGEVRPMAERLKEVVDKLKGIYPAVTHEAIELFVYGIGGNSADNVTIGESTLTEQDKARGYSWTTEIKVKGPDPDIGALAYDDIKEMSKLIGDNSGRVKVATILPDEEILATTAVMSDVLKSGQQSGIDGSVPTDPMESDPGIDTSVSSEAQVTLLLPRPKNEPGRIDHFGTVINATMMTEHGLVVVNYTSSDENMQVTGTAEAVVAYMLGKMVMDNKYGPMSVVIHTQFNEPFFILLGRDPQAPDLVDQWAVDRNQMEPGNPKVAQAMNIATLMRQYKESHPDIGMSANLYNEQQAKELIYLTPRNEKYTEQEILTMAMVVAEAAILSEVELWVSRGTCFTHLGKQDWLDQQMAQLSKLGQSIGQGLFLAKIVNDKFTDVWMPEGAAEGLVNTGTLSTLTLAGLSYNDPGEHEGMEEGDEVVEIPYGFLEDPEPEEE